MKRTLILRTVTLSVVMMIFVISSAFTVNEFQHISEESSNSELASSVKYVGYFENFNVEVNLSSFEDEQWYGCTINLVNKDNETCITTIPNVLRFSFVDGPIFSFKLTPFEVGANSSALIHATYHNNQDSQERNMLKTGIVFLMTLMELFPESVSTPDGIAMMKAIVSVEFDFEGKSYELWPSNLA